MLARVRVAQGKFNLDMQRKLQKPQARGSGGAGASVAMSVEELSATLKASLDAGSSSMQDGTALHIEGGKTLDVGGKTVGVHPHPRPTNDTQALAAACLETLPSSMLYPGGDDKPIPAGEKPLQKSVTVTALELAKVLPPESFASVLQIVVELSAISQLDELELDDWGPAVQAVQAAGSRLRRLLRGTHDVLLMQFIDACPVPFRPHLLDDTPPAPPFPPKAMIAANALFGPLLLAERAAELTQTKATTPPDTAPGVLTAGAVQAMSCPSGGKPSITPTLQLLDIQHDNDPVISKNLYRLVISDGEHLMKAVLATKLNAMVSRGQARDGPSPPAAALGHPTQLPPTPTPQGAPGCGPIHHTDTPPRWLPWQLPRLGIFRLDTFVRRTRPSENSRDILVLGFTALKACDEQIGHPTRIVAAAAGKPVELTASVCAGLNSRLNAAMSATVVPAPFDHPGDWSVVREILATLQASEANVTNLNNLSSSKLSRTVQRLTKHDDPTIASAALSLVQAWAGLVLSPWKADAHEVAAAVQCAVAGAAGFDIPTAPSSAEEVASAC